MFRLTKKADYGLIALKHFAGRAVDGGSEGRPAPPVSAKEVADSYGIPLPLLSKVLQRLTKGGLLISEHGTNGGYRLSRGADSITALEVIRLIDGPVILTTCFTEHARCDHSERCSVRRPLRRIHEGILRLLHSATIQDLLDDSDAEHARPASAGLVALSERSAAAQLANK